MNTGTAIVAASLLLSGVHLLTTFFNKFPGFAISGMGNSIRPYIGIMGWALLLLAVVMIGFGAYLALTGIKGSGLSEDGTLPDGK